MLPAGNPKFSNLGWEGVPNKLAKGGGLQYTVGILLFCPVFLARFLEEKRLQDCNHWTCETTLESRTEVGGRRQWLEMSVSQAFAPFLS